MEKIDARKLSSEQLFEKRQQVIKLYKDSVPKMQIVSQTGLCWSAVNRAISLHKEGSTLKPISRGKKQGKGRTLSAESEFQIYKLIFRRPWQTGLSRPTHLWSRDSVQDLIYQKHGIKLSNRLTGNYLRRWGLGIKKSKAEPCKRCSRKIQKWLNEHYLDIQQHAEKERCEINWCIAPRVLIKMNKIDEINSPLVRVPKRQVISVSNSQGKVRWLIIKGNFSQEKQIKFLEALIKDSRKKVFLIRLDHKNYSKDSVLNWLSDNKDKIELFPSIISKDSCAVPTRKTSSSKGKNWSIEEIDNLNNFGNYYYQDDSDDYNV